jgi:two-component system chemotaxis sensor kinase CheA
MEEDERQQLRENAELLLQREHELFSIRVRDEQLGLWLKLAQSLPTVFSDHRLAAEEILMRVRRLLIAGLRLQRMVFYELDGSTLRPLAPTGPERILPSAVMMLLAAQPSGLCNDPATPGVADLAMVIGLSRFMWSRIVVSGRLPILLVAGYDQAKAIFRFPLDETDIAHFANAAQHVQSLLGNSLLMAELQRERDHLSNMNQALARRERDLQAATEQLHTANETLEQRVLERTQELTSRNRDMRLLLDNVDEALLTVDGEGRLSRERSVMADYWFGSYEGMPLFVDYIAQTDKTFAELFDLSLAALHEGILPLKVCLAQFPTRLLSSEREFRCTYSPISNDVPFTGLLIVINDVTEQVRRAQEEAEHNEILALFQGMMRDRLWYALFAAEFQKILDRLSTESLDGVGQAHHLYTLKGLAASAGANRMVEICHQTEEALTEQDPVRTQQALDRLRERWAVISRTLLSCLGEGGETRIEIATDDLAKLCQDLRQGAPIAPIIDRVTGWCLEPINRMLTRLGQYACDLAVRLGKGPIDVTVDTADIRLEPKRTAGLSSALIQVARNAIDHGLEDLQDRQGCGKPKGGRLWLRAMRVDGSLTIEVEDDGRGIDWDRVRALAVQRHLPHANQQDLLEALLLPGFSTRNRVTLNSGRGIGLSTLQEHVLAIGGQVAVHSVPGSGTCWRITVPLAALGVGV